VLAILLLVPLARWMRPEWLPVGFAVSMAGQAIQTWCFASLVKNRELSIRGPYLLVRNPMYLGRYFLLLGFVLLLGRWQAVAVYTLVYYVYMVNRVRREERRLDRVFGERFRAYCARVRRFLPSFGNLGDRSVWFFDWGMFLENHAHWNLVLTLAAYGALFGIHRTLAAP
jgi:protein-S-isoprenylcysteine O-methyltransferase Ste14